METNDATFAGEGFKPFPNTHADNQQIGEVTTWTDERIEEKLSEYYLFMERDDIMARARTMGQRVIDHLCFEMDQRYDEEMMKKLEDEVCDE